MDNQVYSQTTITDQPFPTVDSVTSGVTNQNAGSGSPVSTPATMQNNPFPFLEVSQQLTSTKLNTSTKKILGAFEFAASGALKIGDFTQGETGEIDISPDGVLAKNLNGDTTFALDGDTGDATFSGELQAGSIVTGQVLVGGEGNEGRILVEDNSGTARVLIGFLQGGF